MEEFGPVIVYEFLTDVWIIKLDCVFILQGNSLIRGKQSHLSNLFNQTILKQYYTQ
jgi:hypothetical protein